MKSKYTLSELFEKAKRDAQMVPVSEVKSLVESGKTSPLAAKISFGPRRITRLFNPLKILIMITPIVIITAALFIWNTGDRKKTEDERQKTERRKTERLEDRTSQSCAPINRVNTDKTKSLGVAVSPLAKPIETNNGDTLFKGEILDVTKEELIRLGFLFDNEGFYYLNRLPDGKLIDLWSWKSGKLSSGGFKMGEPAGKYNKQTATTLDFYPVLSTDIYGDNLFMPNLRKTFVPDSFNIMNDTLVPVLFKSSTYGGSFSGNLLIWFKPSDTFFRLIDPGKGEVTQRRIERVKEIVLNSSVQKDLVKYEFPTRPAKAEPIVSTLKTVKLSPEIFRCMGFDIASDTVEYLFKGPDRWLTLSVYGKGTRMKIHMTMDSLQANQERVKLFFIARFTADGGSQPIGNAFGIHEAYLEQLELCVPVQLDNPALPPFVRDAIFWIYPTDRFFECLPPEIGGPMKKEFNYQAKYLELYNVQIMGDSIGIGGEKLKKDSVNESIEPVPCVYFTNLCESLPGLDYINLYPNPATDLLSMDLVLQKALMIRFRVIDLGGRVISDEGAPKDFPAGGRFTHQMDVSKLQNGFYLLVMTDEKGAKLTRRFVKN